MDAKSLISEISKNEFSDKYRELNWAGSFEDYLNIVIERPQVARRSFQRVYDMIAGYGSSKYKEYKKEIVHYHFFDDPIDNGKDAIFGLDVHLMKLVNVFKAGAHRYGPEKRVILLHGPVGSSKSTIARLLKKGLEQYTRTPEGALYTTGVQPGQGRDFYFLNGSGAAGSLPVELVAVDAPENGELLRFSTNGSSLMAGVDESGQLWLRVGPNLVRPLPLIEYAEVVQR